MKNRRLEAKLRLVEHGLSAIDNPQTCGTTMTGSVRSISPTAKTRELEQLVTKLAECQQLVETDSEQEWLEGVKSTLKTRLNEVFNPPLIN